MRVSYGDWRVFYLSISLTGICLNTMQAVRYCGIDFTYYRMPGKGHRGLSRKTPEVSATRQPTVA